MPAARAAGRAPAAAGQALPPRQLGEMAQPLPGQAPALLLQPPNIPHKGTAQLHTSLPWSFIRDLLQTMPFVLNYWGLKCSKVQVLPVGK